MTATVSFRLSQHNLHQQLKQKGEEEEEEKLEVPKARLWRQEHAAACEEVEVVQKARLWREELACEEKVEVQKSSWLWRQEHACEEKVEVQKAKLWREEHACEERQLGAVKGVKEIVDAGISYVPPRFIRPPSQRPSLSQVSDTHHLPVVDFSGFSGRRRSQVLADIAKASQEWGFFQLVNHGFPQHVVTKIWDASHMFFQQPAAERMRFYSEDLRQPVAYMTSFDIRNEKVSEWKDSLIFRCFPGQFDGFSQAPHYCRKAVVEYIKEMGELASKIYEALSESLGLAGDYLESKTANQKRMTMPIHYYPTCPDPSLTFGMSGHSDPNNFTILLQDDVGGLQIMKDAKWVAVKTIPNAFVVNLGDQIQIMTNGRYKSVEHRVVTNRERPRMSIPCLFCPNLEAKIGPLVELVGEANPALYKETVFREYLQQFNKVGLAGKACLDLYKVHKSTS